MPASASPAAPVDVAGPILTKPRSCAQINSAQNAALARKCAGKVNHLSCKCSTCESASRYPVLTSPADAVLLNTAQDGQGGFLTSGLDAHWEVGMGTAGGGPASVSSWMPASVYHNLAWTSSPFGNANWIGSQMPPSIHVYFRYRFNLANAVSPTTFSLTLDFFADDQVRIQPPCASDAGRST